MRWEFSFELIIFLGVDNFLLTWGLSFQLRIFFCCGSLVGCVIYRTKMFDSLCSLCLVLWASCLYSLEHMDSLEFTGEKFLMLMKWNFFKHSLKCSLYFIRVARKKFCIFINMPNHIFQCTYILLKCLQIIVFIFLWAELTLLTAKQV